jgi:diguanylate cyclase (GGDEF)-like protein
MTTVSPPAPVRRICRSACAAVIAVVTLVFVGGWVLGDVALRSLVAGTVGMKWQTACGLGSAAVALLLLLEHDQDRPGRRRAGHACAGAVLGLGLAVLSEYIVGWRLGIDELFWKDTAGRALGIAYPGRLAPTTATCFVLTGLALLSIDRRPLRIWRPAELLVLPVALLGTMTVIGYLYEIPAFYGPSSAAKMALGTGACFLALTTAVLLSRPRGRLVTLATTDDPGGILIRRLVPVAFLVPLTLGWARLRAGDAGLFGDRVGTWWLTAATVGLFVGLICQVAGRLSQYAARGRALEAELFFLANHDALTGLHNRHRFDQDLTHAVARAHRYDEPLSLLTLDLDGLKAANDSLGHAAGDALIREVAQALGTHLREVDLAGRLGGDEFAVMLPATNADGARVLAERLRAALAALEIRGAAGPVRTTASIGVATLDDGDRDAEALMARADAAMYEGKRAGGDCVSSFFAAHLAGGDRVQRV